jgi:asparaginyl-tRNA synthetase
MASIACVRSEMVHAAHAFFPTNGFFNVNTPITTATATTVAGDRCSRMFRVMQLKIDQIVHTAF